MQARIATELIEQLSETGQGYICREVLVGFVWVLERAYDRVEIAAVLSGLFPPPNWLLRQQVISALPFSSIAATVMALRI